MPPRIRFSENPLSLAGHPFQPLHRKLRPNRGLMQNNTRRRAPVHHQLTRQSESRSILLGTQPITHNTVKEIDLHSIIYDPPR